MLNGLARRHRCAAESGRARLWIRFLLGVSLQLRLWVNRDGGAAESIAANLPIHQRRWSLSVGVKQGDGSCKMLSLQGNRNMREREREREREKVLEGAEVRWKSDVREKRLTG